MKYVNTFEAYLYSNYIDKLIAESEELINEAQATCDINESYIASLYENASEEEIDEACERAFNELIEDRNGFFRIFDNDEDLGEAVSADTGAGKANNAAKKLSSVVSSATKGLQAASSMGIGLPSIPVASLAKTLMFTGGIGLAIGAAAGAGFLLYKFIKKRRELKKALAGVPDGPKKDALRAQYKKMSTSELEQMNQINAAKAKIQGAKDGASGAESKPPAEDTAKAAYGQGYSEGQKALVQAKKIKELPKEEKEKEGKELAAKAKSAKEIAKKLEKVENKLKELK